MHTKVIRYNPLPAEREICQQLAMEMKIPYGVAVLLCRRGLTERESVSAFLHPQLADLPSPFLMKDMTKAVDMVIQASMEQWTVLIHGDYDVDGISGTALLSLFLKNLNRDVQQDRSACTWRGMIVNRLISKE